MLPREFKPHINTLAGSEIAKSTFDRLAEITSTGSKIVCCLTDTIEGMETLIVRRPSQKQRNEYVNYRLTAKEELPDRGGSFSRRGSNRAADPVRAMTPYSQAEQHEYTFDGKKKRKRFNEDLANETVSILSKQSQKAAAVAPLTAGNVGQLKDETQGTGQPSVKSNGQPSVKSKSTGRSSAILRAIIKSATEKKIVGGKSETASEYRQKVIGLVK